jgi:type I restriction enzyme M protein
MDKQKKIEIIHYDASINVSTGVEHIWSIAKTLRGAYSSDKYKNVVIPMIVIRRLECALDKTKSEVVTVYEKNRSIPEDVLKQKAGFKFYNTSPFTLTKLLDDSKNIASNFKDYIGGFSKNIQEIINNLDFKEEIEHMDKKNRLYGVIKKFSELDLDPATVSNHAMGYMFEELIRRFSANAKAGEHYTPREVIGLMVNILLAEGCDDLLTKGKVTTVLDMACGTGGMLSTTDYFLHKLNNNAEVHLFGQETISESYAICLADMLIKGQDSENIRLQDTMIKDCFKNQMRLVIANPPFGMSWGGEDAPEGLEKAVKDEYATKDHGRWKGGLPAKGDEQLLFVQHAIAKMDEDRGRAAIIQNGSPLFSGNTATSGESQIRRYLLENDLLEAIIGLTTDLFYNTPIGIYIFILSKNKRPERKNKIQLINAVDYYKPMKKSLGKKHREISKKDIEAIVELYANFKENKDCKIFDKEEFLYKEFSVYQPLQRNYAITKERIEKMLNSDCLDSVYSAEKIEELEENVPRKEAENKKLAKLKAGKPLYNKIIKTLESVISDKIYKKEEDFMCFFNSKFSDIENDLRKKIAFALSEMDKTAEVQKDKNGNVIYDSTTKDTELVKLNMDVEEYFKKEVYPHVPDAHYIYEYGDKGKLLLYPSKQSKDNLSKEKIGAEFPFTRYFYEYKEPEKADVLLKEFMKLEKSVSGKVKGLEM